MKRHSENCMGVGKLWGDPDHKVGFVISDGAVTTPKIADRAVTPEKLSADVVNRVFYPMLDKASRELQQQINAINANGVALSNSFGMNPCIGMSQKAISEAFIWLVRTVGELTGKDVLDVKFTVEPAVTSDLIADITVDLIPPFGEVEKVSLYIDGRLVDREIHTDHYTFETTVNQSCSIKVEYDFFGKHFAKQKTVQIGKDSKEGWAYMGSGDIFLDIYKKPEYLKDYQAVDEADKILVGTWGDRIIIIMDESLKQNVESITMSGFDIPFDIDSTTLSGYSVYTSKNKYINGVWPIDIAMRASA